MGTRAEAIAKRFEAKVDEATAAFEKLSDADWKKQTAGEKWSVGVVAHHIASSHELIADIARAVASGQSKGDISMAMLDEMNAKQAVENANCTKPETIALHRKNAAGAAAIVRSLADADLDKSGPVLSGMPPMTVEQIAVGILINHIDEHLASIRAAV